jgi:hypothetical protein
MQAEKPKETPAVVSQPKQPLGETSVASGFRFTTYIDDPVQLARGLGEWQEREAIASRMAFVENSIGMNPHPNPSTRVASVMPVPFNRPALTREVFISPPPPPPCPPRHPGNWDPSTITDPAVRADYEKSEYERHMWQQSRDPVTAFIPAAVVTGNRQGTTPSSLSTNEGEDTSRASSTAQLANRVVPQAKRKKVESRRPKKK